MHIYEREKEKGWGLGRETLKLQIDRVIRESKEKFILGERIVLPSG